jgi:hypothetical protein
MKKLISIAFIALLYTSCSENEEANFYYVVLPVEEATIPASFEWNQTYDITLKYELPNGCHFFYSLYYKTEDTKRVIAINAIVNDEDACTEALITKEHTFKIKATQKERYILKIYKGIDEDGESIFEEITVPVTETPAVD